MSGVVALFSTDGKLADHELLRAMTAAQRFRGPDGEAIWHRGSVGLGHTLHATTPGAQHEQHPCSLHDRLFIVADARVDARAELCDRLRERGAHVRNDAPDAELLLHAYDVWDERFLEHVLGDFSFALWDAPRRKLLCAVDHLGIKPFFYAHRGGLFSGANSLECVRLHPHVRRDLNEIAVADFLAWGSYTDRSATIYADITRIAPGHLLVVEPGGLQLRRYFEPLEAGEERRWCEADCIEEFEQLLEQAVSDRLRAPRCAVFMSGGVDSPLVAATAKRALERRFSSPVLEAFTGVHDRLFTDDERRYAGLAARSLDIPVDFEPLDDADRFDWVGRVVPPEPAHASGLGPALGQMTRVASRFSIALTGWDGDALLGAAVRLHWYERIREGRFRALGRELTWYVRHERGLPPIGVRTQLRRIYDWRGRRSRPSPPGWLRSDFRRRVDFDGRWRSRLPQAPSGSRGPAAWSFMFPAWALVFSYYDPASLGAALEVRHPLADLRLIRFALGLAAVPWCVDKHLLRRCAGALPEAVRKRPKTPLRADPDVLRFRARGLGRVAGQWRGADALEAFANTAAIERAAAQRTAPADEITWLLRIVGLGLWLKARDGALDLESLARAR